MNNMESLSDVLIKIHKGEFDVKDASPPVRSKPLREMNVLEREQFQAEWNEYRVKQHEANMRFRECLAKVYNVSEHKNEPKLWELAWEHGHANGLSEVLNSYDELVQLLK